MDGWVRRFNIPEGVPAQPLQSNDMEFLQPFVSLGLDQNPWFYEDGDLGYRVMIYQPSYADTDCGGDYAGLFFVTIYSGDSKRVDLSCYARDRDDFNSLAEWHATYEGASFNGLNKTSSDFYTPRPWYFSSDLIEFPDMFSLNELFQDTSHFGEIWGIEVPPLLVGLPTGDVFYRKVQELCVGLSFVNGAWEVIP